MIHPVYLYLPGYILLCGCIIRTHTSCPHPDVPAYGNYIPEKIRFEPGDEITYSCKKGFALSGKERRICKLNDVWSDHTPFCDHAAELQNPSVTNDEVMLSLVSPVIDGDSDTCFEWLNATGQHMYVHLHKKIIIRLVKIFLNKGTTKIQVLTGLNNDMKLCAEYVNFIETDQWVLINCRNNVLADTVKILVTENEFLTVCEIEVYGKEEDDCERSPNRNIPNGYFEVSRSRATLICEDGFKTERYYNRLVCEDNNIWTGERLKCEEVLCKPHYLTRGIGMEWKILDKSKKLSVGTRSQFECRTGYQKVGDHDTVFCQKNGDWTTADATCVAEETPHTNMRGIILGVGATVLVIIVFLLFGAVPYYVQKQRQKEVQVIFQLQSDECAIPESAKEYAQDSPYECQQNRAPELPSTPRPMAKLSTMSSKGSFQSQGRKGALKNKDITVDIAFHTPK